MTSRPAPNEKDKKRFQRAMKLHEEGKPKEAIRLFDKVRKSWGDDADIWYLIGLAHGKLGEMKQVKHTSMKALKMNPEHFGALCNLANAQIMLGEHNTALENYRKSLTIKPDDPVILESYGRALAAVGQNKKAIECFSKSLEYKPDYAPAHASLAKSYVEDGLPEEAFAEYQKALQLDSSLADAHLGIGRLYTYIGDMPNAERHFHEALNLQSNLIDAYIGLYSAHRHQGDFEEALRILSKAKQIEPKNPSLSAAKADILQRMGDIEGAYKLLQVLNEHNQMSPLSIEVFSRVCQKFEVCDEALKLIEVSATVPHTNITEKQTLRYAAGHLLDKRQRYDEAFKWFQAANETVAISFNIEAQRALINQIIKAYSKEAMTSLPRASTGSRRPIFILGMPRSGTTLTEQILASHVDVYGAGELSYIRGAAKNAENMQPTQESSPIIQTDHLTEDRMTELAKQYLQNINALNSEARYVTDKMPHNFLRIGLINLLFPEARIIHCQRDPMDNGLSIYFQNFLWTHRYATNLENIGHFYNEYQRLMQHWKQVTNIPILDVSYEDMIRDSETTARKILSFCELDWNDSVMDFHKNKRVITTASIDQVRQPIYSSSISRWKNYEQHIEPLKVALSI